MERLSPLTPMKFLHKQILTSMGTEQTHTRTVFSRAREMSHLTGLSKKNLSKSFVCFMEQIAKMTVLLQGIKILTHVEAENFDSSPETAFS